MQKGVEEEAETATTVNRMSLVTLEDKCNGQSSIDAPAVSSKSEQNLWAPAHVEGKHNTEKSNSIPAESKLKSNSISGNIGEKLRKEKIGTASRSEAKLGAPKRPASALYEKNRIQLSMPHNSRVHSESNNIQGHDDHAKRGKTKSAGQNGAGQPALTPVAGKGQALPGSTINGIRVEPQLSTRYKPTDSIL
jgi:hypothetical protein